jgi:hypothetical protein
MLAATGCGSSEPSVARVEQVAKRELGASHVRCNTNAPPHEYQCEYTAPNGFGDVHRGVAYLRAEGKRIWVTDSD